MALAGDSSAAPQARGVAPFARGLLFVSHSPGISRGLRSQRPGLTGVGPLPMNNPNGVRMSTSLTYLGATRHRLNLTVRSNVMVQRILLEGTRAVGVEAESGGETFAIECEQVVLCAGAVASPQILMLSGIGPMGHLQEMGIPVVKDLPGVGKNLRDHPCARSGSRPSRGSH